MSAWPPDQSTNSRPQPGYRARVIALFVIAQWMLSCVPQVAPDAGPIPADVDYAAVIEILRSRLPQTMEQSAVPGLSIAMVDGDRVVWAEGFGYADQLQRTPVTADTLFRVQSISKSYTALAVLRAVESGVLVLDDPLIDHVPGFRIQSRLGRDEVRKITVRRLLSHWASLPHEAPLRVGCEKRHRTHEEHVDNISHAWLVAPVGSRYRYSNLGYDLAGSLLQSKYGAPFPRVAQTLVLDPLGMENSTFDQEQALKTSSIASGHRGGAPLPPEYMPGIPSGALYSSAREMARFVAYQLTGRTRGGERLLSDGLRAEMRRPQFLVERQVGGYGLGLVSEPWHGATLVYHDGSGYGYAGTHRWMPEYGVGVVVLTNSSEGRDLAGALANRTLQLMVQEKTGPWPDTEPLSLTDQPERILEPDQLQRVEGTYKPTGKVVSFQVSDGRLLYIDGRDAVPLQSHGAETFIGGERRFTFEFSGAGKPDGAHVLGRFGVAYMPINDFPGEPPGPDRPEWSAHVGRYVDDEGQQVEVLRRNGYLYLTREGELKLAEYRPGLFFTSEGEPVRFERQCMVIAGTPFKRGQ